MTKAPFRQANHNVLIWAVLAILAVPTFLPLLYSGLSNSDSIIFFATTRSLQDVSSLLGMSYKMFLLQGRFTNLLTGWALFLPYYTQSHFVYLLLTILPVILDVILAAVLVRKYSRNETIAQMTALVLLCAFTIHTGFSGVIGFPFWFTFSFLFLLISLLFLLRYKETQKYRSLLLSALFMFITTTFYEAYLAYYIVIYLLLRSQYDNHLYREKTIRRKFIKELLPFVVCGVVFIAVYFILFHIVSQYYSGTDWCFSPLKILRSWGNIILYSIPGMSFYQYRIPLADLSGDPNFKYSFFYMLFHAGAMAWVKGLLAALLFYVTFAMLEFKTKGKKLWFALLVAVMMAILPHLILSCSTKYIQDIFDSYVTTIFSNFGMAFIIVVLFLLGRHYLSKWPVAQTVYAVLFACGLLILAVVVQFTNEQVMQDVKRANLRYTQAEQFLKKQKIKPDGTMPVWTGRFQVTPTYTGKDICAGKNTNVQVYLGLSGNFETDYTHFYQTYRTSDDDVAIFSCQQAAKSDDIYFVWFQCKGTDLTEDFTKLACDTIKVGYYSAYKSFAFSILSEQDSDMVQVNGQPLNTQANAHYGNIRFLNRPALQTFTVSGESMLPASLSISNILYPGLEPLNFNKLPKHYFNDGVRYYQHDIWKHQLYKAQLDSLALQQDKDPKRFFRDNAKWLLLYREQY
ncbi:MAG: hypothetical protein J5741_01580 [Bacteroidales bacterium]|nr:hypothetical protein [Bacteroidales bacterium]